MKPIKTINKQKQHRKQNSLRLWEAKPKNIEKQNKKQKNNNKPNKTKDVETTLGSWGTFGAQSSLKMPQHIWCVLVLFVFHPI